MPSRRSRAPERAKLTIYEGPALRPDEVQDSERAIDAYKNIVDLDDVNLPALEALAKLYDKTDNAQPTVNGLRSCPSKKRSSEVPPKLVANRAVGFASADGAQRSRARAARPARRRR